MGFTREQAGSMALGLTYYDTDPMTGEALAEPQRCVFFVRRRNNTEAKAQARDNAVSDDNAATDAIMVERLASMTIAPPRGFDDFPLTEGEFQERFRDRIQQDDIPAGTDAREVAARYGVTISDRPLKDRMVDYFSDPQLYIFADHAIALYMRRAMPAELSFRF